MREIKLLRKFSQNGKELKKRLKTKVPNGDDVGMVFCLNNSCRKFSAVEELCCGKSILVERSIDWSVWN